MEAGLFTLRFVITGLSTKKAAEICNTSEKTYKKWEATRIYPISALESIRQNALKQDEVIHEDVLVEQEEDYMDCTPHKIGNVLKFPE